MDERLMKKCVGAPVPEWDRAHRLSISRPAGPEIKDLGTVFGVNSTFMDVIDPAFLDKQWVIMVVFIAFLAMGIGPYIYYFTHSDESSGDFVMNGIAIFAVARFRFDCLASRSRPVLWPALPAHPVPPRDA